MPASLDNNATTKPEQAVVDAVRLMLEEHWHNPSSIHRPGQAARQKIELARQAVARLIGALPRDLIFTSGATESIDLALRGVMLASAPSRTTIITSPIEHEAVRDAAAAIEKDSGGRLRRVMLPVLPSGVVDTEALPALLDDSVALVSIQWANNETGIIQPIERIGALCRERRVPFHTDATQWVGKMQTDVGAAPIDLMSFSAHKFHGPKGVGALWVRQGVRLRPVIHGTQERERRGGTENAPGIVGMGVAAELAYAWLSEPQRAARIALLRDQLEAGILRGADGSAVNGSGPRLWNTTNIAFPKLEAEALLLLLSERGVCASAGAACSSGSLDPSPVLLAMGVPEELAHGSLRFSLSRDTTPDEIEEALGIITACAARLRGSTASVV